jgi:demethylmenaquinone methyltransferase/2-methoxy-6-polyprenyl-1,4-benzoquinol methylase
MKGLLDYYARRAGYYEDIYAIPERQEDLARLKSRLRELLAGHDILEVACGTGYFTAEVSGVARSIVATDAVEEVLEIARAKTWPPGKVRFEQRDAWDLSGVCGAVRRPRLTARLVSDEDVRHHTGFTAGLAAFWWSHVPRERLADFLRGFHTRVGSGGLFVYCDNPYVPGNSTPITSTDGDYNTYQTRRLKDGSEHEVLKNYYSPEEMFRAVEMLGGREIDYKQWTWYWLLSYEL